MQAVLQRHPDDPDVACIAASAMMNLDPWKLWEKGAQTAETTAAIKAALEAGLAAAPEHPGLWIVTADNFEEMVVRSAGHFFVRAASAEAPSRSS